MTDWWPAGTAATPTLRAALTTRGVRHELVPSYAVPLEDVRAELVPVASETGGRSVSRVGG
jgi:hypothetical protein